MPRILSRDLRDCLERPNPYVRRIVEVSSPDVGQILRRPDQFVGSGSALVSGTMTPAASLAASVAAGLSLAPTTTALASYTGTQGYYDLNTENPQRRRKGLAWAVDPAFGRALLRSVTAVVKRLPIVAGVYLQTDFQLQLFRVTRTPGVRTSGDPGSPSYRSTAWTEYAFTDVLPSTPVVKAASIVWDGATQLATLSFDLSQYGAVVSGAPGTAAAPDQAGELPTYYFVVTPVTPPKATGLFQWRTDTASVRTVAGVGSFRTSFWARDSDAAQWVETDQGGVPTATINIESYPVSGQAVYALDMGRAPAAGSAGRIRFERSVPTGAAAALELSTAGSAGPWTTATDGDVVSGAQRYYWLRLTLSSDSSRRASPGITGAGVEWRTPVDVSLESTIELPTREIALPYATTSVPEGRVTILRTGVRDYLDVATTLASTAATTKLEADIFLASDHPSVPRDKWLRLERLAVSSRTPGATSETLTCLGLSARLKRKIPAQAESISTVHTVVSGTTAAQIVVSPALANATATGNEYDGKRYYVRVRTSAVLAFPPNYQQVIQGNTGVDRLDFVPALPAALAAGDVIEVHSGVFAPPELSFVDADPADAWWTVLDRAGIPRERIGLGYLPRGGVPPVIAVQSPGDSARQARLRVTLRLTEQETAQDLLDQLSFILGGATTELDGQIVFVQLYPLRAGDGTVTVPLAPVAATLDVRDFAADPVLSPDYERRSPLVTAKYGVNSAAASPDAYPEQQTAVVDSDAVAWTGDTDLESGQIPDSVSRWLYNSAASLGDSGLTLATALADRVVRAASTGLRVFRLSLTDARPDLVPGDSVVIVTDSYTDVDPSTLSQVRGPVAIRGVLTSVGAEGRNLAMFVGGLAENVVQLGGGQPSAPVALDTAPAPPVVQISFTAAGAPVVTLTGAPGTLSMRCALSLSGDPGDAAAEAAPVRAGSVVSYTDTSLTAAEGASVYARAFAYSRADGVGARSAPATLIAVRQGRPAAALPPVCVLTDPGDTDGLRYASVTVSALTQGPVPPGGLEYRTRTDTQSGGASTAWSAWATLSTSATIRVLRANYYAKLLYGQVRETTSGLVSQEAVITIASYFEGLDQATGRVRRGVPLDDGQYAVRASNTDGSTVDSGVGDSVGRRVNRFYAKALSADPDNADALNSDGVLRAVTTLTQRDGGARGYTALDTSARLQTGLLAGVDMAGTPAGYVARSLQGVFLETFETVPDWTVRTAPSSSSLVSTGQAGGKAFSVTGQAWYAFPFNIAFNPTKLYRMRCRVRQLTGSSATTVYIGVEGVGADGTTLVNSTGGNDYSGQHYVAVTDVALSAGAGWSTFTGWFRGWGTYAQSANPLTPSPLHPDVRYMRPMFLLNFNAGTGTAEIDEISIDVVDEDATARVYTAIDGGNIVTTGAIDFARPYIGKNGSNIPRISGSGASLGAVVGRLDDFGNAASSFAESGGKAVNRFFAKGVASEADNLGTIPDDSVRNYYRTSQQQRDGGGRGFTALDVNAKLQTGVLDTAIVGDVQALRLARQSGRYFSETFDSLPGTRYSINVGGTVALAPGAGETGRNALAITNTDIRYLATPLPFNPTFLYRLRARFRQTVDNTQSGGGSLVFLGLISYDAAGTQIGGNLGNYILVNNYTATVANGWQTVTAWVKGANNSPNTNPSAAPSTDPKAPSTLFAGTVAVAPMWIFNYSPGNGTAQLDYFQIDELDEAAAALVYNNFTGVGIIAPAVTQNDSWGARVMMRGYQRGQYRNGDAVTFAASYAGTPKIRVSGGQKNEPRALWGANGGASAPSISLPQIEDMGLDSISRTGGNVRARLKQPGNTAAQSDAFAAPTTVTTAGAVTSTRAPTAVANDGTYRITGTLAISQAYSLDVGGTQSVSVTVAMDVDVAGNNGWIEVATQTLTRIARSTSEAGTTSVALSLQAVRSDVTTVSGFRLRMKTFTDGSYSSSATGTASALTYTTATGELYASATYDPYVMVTMESWEGETAP